MWWRRMDAGRCQIDEPTHATPALENSRVEAPRVRDLCHSLCKAGQALRRAYVPRRRPSQADPGLGLLYVRSERGRADMGHRHRYDFAAVDADGTGLRFHLSP